MLADLAPNKNHVLCGRGKINVKHPGNIKFASIIRSSLQEYIQAPSRLDKAIVVASIATFIRKECGLQFIKFNDATKKYVALSQERIHDKVSHAIRDEMRKQAKSATKQANTKKMAKRRLPTSIEKSSSEFTGNPMRENLARARLSKNVASIAASKTIFDLGGPVDDMGSVIELKDSLENLLAGIMPDSLALPEITSNPSPPEREEHFFSPLPFDRSAPESMEFEYQDIRRVCSILERQGGNEHGDFGMVFDKLFP